MSEDFRVWWYEVTSEGRRRRWKRCASLPEAERLLAALRAQTSPVATESSTPSMERSNDEVFDAFLISRADDPEGTRRKYASLADVWLRPAMGARRGADMGLELYMAPLRAARRAGRSLSTIESIETVLGAIANFAVVAGCWGPQPFGPELERRAHVRELKRAVRRDRADQRAAILLAGDGDHDRGIVLDQVPSWAAIEALSRAIEQRERVGPRKPGPARAQHLAPDVAAQIAKSVLVAAAVGLRECELLALHSSVIDRDSGLVSVVRQLDRYRPWIAGQPPPVRSPKYGKTRKALCFTFYFEELCGLADWADRHTGGWLFSPTRQQRWWAEGWQATVGRGLLALDDDYDAAVVAGITPAPPWRWRLHYLRHFYASVALAPPEEGFGLALALVSEYLGHASPEFTARVYVQTTAHAAHHARVATSRRPAG